jgi:formylglycine-generating enzyme required for sulfatase activity
MKASPRIVGLRWSNNRVTVSRLFPLFYIIIIQGALNMSNRKRFFIQGIVIIAMIAMCCISSRAGIIQCHVQSVSGSDIKIDIGENNGVSVGDKGWVFYKVTLGGVEKPVYVAGFKIAFISPEGSMAEITDKTAEVAVGYLGEVEMQEVKKSEVKKEEIKQEKAIEPAKSFSNSLGVKFEYIKPGTFMMGSPANEKDRDNNETQHQVTLTKGFYMGVTEVTVGQWRPFVLETGYKTEAETSGGAYIFIDGAWSQKAGYYWANPGFIQTENDPVTCISWNDVEVFIKWLNEKEGTDKYRLPMESEWEYACRAGSTGRFSFGDNESEIGEYAWHSGNAVKKTHPVATKKPNAFGLYDMHGNVWEWVQDWYGEYPSGSVIDPGEPLSGSNRVNKGGGWYSVIGDLRSAIRSQFVPSSREYDIGFRLARAL